MEVDCSKDESILSESLLQPMLLYWQQIHSGEAESQSATVSVAVADVSIQVQLESWDDEELRQLRDEVKMLRMKCQRSSGTMTSCSINSVTLACHLLLICC